MATKKKTKTKSQTKRAAKKPARKAAPAAKKAGKKKAPKKSAAKSRTVSRKPAAKAAPKAKVKAKKPAAKVVPKAQAPAQAPAIRPVRQAAPPQDPALAERIRSLWGRLEAWASQHGGRSLALGNGAAPAAIEAAEEAMGVAFPAGFRASLLLHEGQTTFSDGSSPSFPWMPGCPQLAPLSAILGQWKDVQGLAAEYPPPDDVDDDRRLRAGLYRTGRIPIAGTPWWDGDTTYLDLDPGPEGTSGQVITMVSECDFVVLGKSFEEVLERWVAALEGGDWTYDREKHAEHRRGDAPHSGHPSYQFAEG